MNCKHQICEPWSGPHLCLMPKGQGVSTLRGSELGGVRLGVMDGWTHQTLPGEGAGNSPRAECHTTLIVYTVVEARLCHQLVPCKS